MIEFPQKEGMYMKYKRGDICYYDFGYQMSSVQGGTRPCVVVGNNKQNDSSSICVVVPITTALKTNLPTHISIPDVEFEKGKIYGTILCEQLITVDQSVLRKTGKTLDYEILQKVNKALAIELDLNFHHTKEKEDFIEALSYMKETIIKQRQQINELKSLLRPDHQKSNKNSSMEKQKRMKLIKSVK